METTMNEYREMMDDLDKYITVGVREVVCIT